MKKLILIATVCIGGAAMAPSLLVGRGNRFVQGVKREYLGDSATYTYDLGKRETKKKSRSARHLFRDLGTNLDTPDAEAIISHEQEQQRAASQLHEYELTPEQIPADQEHEDNRTEQISEPEEVHGEPEKVFGSEFLMPKEVVTHEEREHREPQEQEVVEQDNVAPKSKVRKKRSNRSSRAYERMQAIDKELDESEGFDQEQKIVDPASRASNRDEPQQEENCAPAEAESLALFSIEREFDPEFKKSQVVHLVDRAVEFFNKEPMDKALNAFNTDPAFRSGEVYIFVFDDAGNCLANVQESDLTWKNLIKAKGEFDVGFVQEMIARAHTGGGWVSYKWRNATRLVYVKGAQKNGKRYLLCAGYCPHSKADMVINLVKGAVTYFNNMIHNGYTRDDAFSTFNYPLGQFVFGDLYLYALSQEGIQVAHGELPGIVGTNVLNYQDKNGKYVNKEIIAKLKNADLGTGVWIEYVSRNAVKKSYAERVVDKDGQSYFIACGFYPSANRNKAIDLVDRGYRYMKTNGRSAAAAAFSNILSPDFRYGDIALAVFSMSGKCIANGANPSLVGKEIPDFKSDDGILYVKEFIDRAKTGRGTWIDFKEKNSYKSVWVERIDLGTEKYIICAGIFPITKRETMLLGVRAAAGSLQANAVEKTCAQLVRTDGPFIRGDLDILLLDSNGICFASGNDYRAIWQNFMGNKDQNGKEYIKLLINTIQKTKLPQFITYKLNNQVRLAYGQPVEKDGTTYIVSSGFYF